MLELIPLLRSDRRREIEEYKLRGYYFLNKSRYLYLRNIVIPYNKENYEFQVRVDTNEVRFLLTKKDKIEGENSREDENKQLIYMQTIYLTIEEIYLLMKNMCDEIGTDKVISILNDYLSKNKNTNNTETFNIKYLELDYKLNFIKSDILDNIFNKQVTIPNTDIKIDCIQGFLLLFLIQDKSNYLFSISTVYNKRYKNGIVRLILVLISLEHENSILSNLGWNYKENKFELEYKRLKRQNTRKSKKYYLTEKEMNVILNI
ncbi:hypothetical protein FC778_07825 [Clostridium botulinum]|nr:hypothetical protein [Clostridium botulinum]